MAAEDRHWLAQLRRFLPARESDPVGIPRILLRGDDLMPCHDLVAMGLLEKRKSGGHGARYAITDTGVAAVR